MSEPNDSEARLVAAARVGDIGGVRAALAEGFPGKRLSRCAGRAMIAAAENPDASAVEEDIARCVFYLGQIAREYVDACPCDEPHANYALTYFLNDDLRSSFVSSLGRSKTLIAQAILTNRKVLLKSAKIFRRALNRQDYNSVYAMLELGFQPTASCMNMVVRKRDQKLLNACVKAGGPVCPIVARYFKFS